MNNAAIKSTEFCAIVTGLSGHHYALSVLARSHYTTANGPHCARLVYSPGRMLTVCAAN